MEVRIGDCINVSTDEHVEKWTPIVDIKTIDGQEYWGVGVTLYLNRYIWFVHPGSFGEAMRPTHQVGDYIAKDEGLWRVKRFVGIDTYPEPLAIYVVRPPTGTDKYIKLPAIVIDLTPEV